MDRFRRDPRDLDEDEESWFDDEEEATASENVPPPPSIASLPRFVPSVSSDSSFSYSPRPPLSTLTRAPLALSAAPRQSLVSNLENKENLVL